MTFFDCLKLLCSLCLFPFFDGDYVSPFCCDSGIRECKWLWCVTLCVCLCLHFLFFLLMEHGGNYRVQWWIRAVEYCVCCPLCYCCILGGDSLFTRLFCRRVYLMQREEGKSKCRQNKKRWSALRGVHEWIENWKIKWYRVCLQYFCVAVWSVDIHFPSQSTHHLSPHLFCLSLFFLSISFSLCLFCQFWWATSCAAGSCRECPVDSIVLRRIDSIHFRPGTCCDSDCLVLWITPLFAKSNLVYPMPVQPVLALFQCLISMRHSPVSIDFILSFIADSNLSLFSWSMMSTKPKHRYVLIAWMSRVRF